MQKHTLIVTFVGALLTMFSATATAAPYDQSDGTVLYSGTLWQEGKNAIEGHWFVEELESGERFLRLGDDFKTKKAPDLKIILSQREVDSITKRNVLTSGTVLELLDSHEGAQSFKIPDSVELKDIVSVAIHCEEYGIFWGAAPFNPGKVLFASGEWTKKSERVKGSYEIAEVDGGIVLRTSADFSTKKAPDLKFVLSNTSVRDANNNNALSGGTVIAELTSNKGAQEYELPAGVDPSGFKTLLVHCEQYTKLWAAAPLTVSG